MSSLLQSVPAVINWKVVPGSLTKIEAASKDTVWGLDGQDRAYCLTQGKFDYVADNRKIISISCGESGVWAVDDKGTVLYREGVSPSELKGSSWTAIENIPSEYDAVIQVDVAEKGHVCVVTKLHHILCRGQVDTLNPKGVSWDIKVGKLSRLSCGGFGCWGVGARGRNVWFKISLEQSNKWRWEKVKDVPMSTVKVGDDGSVWAINGNGYLFARQGVSLSNAQGNSWIRVSLSKQFQDVTMAGGVLFGVSTTGAVYECELKIV